MWNIKKILIAVLSFSLLFAISCDNEGKTGGGGTGGGGGVSGGGNGGGGSVEVEILTPEEGTYNVAYSDDYYHYTGITVKINEDNTVQISGKAGSINYKTFAEASQNYNCKTSDWIKQSGTDYKISKSIVSEKMGNYVATTMNNAEVKWRYLNTNGYKHIELDLNFEDNNGRPFRSVALKRATR